MATTTATALQTVADQKHAAAETLAEHSALTARSFVVDFGDAPFISTSVFLHAHRAERVDTDALAIAHENGDVWVSFDVTVKTDEQWDRVGGHLSIEQAKALRAALDEAIAEASA